MLGILYTSVGIRDVFGAPAWLSDSNSSQNKKGIELRPADFLSLRFFSVDQAPKYNPLELQNHCKLFLAIVTSANHQNALIPLSVMFISHFTVREVTCHTSGEELYGLTTISVETKLLQYSGVTILSTFPKGLVNASLQIPPWTNSLHCVNPFDLNSRHAFQTKEDTSTSLANNRSKSLEMIFQFVSS